VFYKAAHPEPEETLKPLLFVIPSRPAYPATCGEIFNERLAGSLGSRFALTVITPLELGLNIDAPSELFAKRLIERVRSCEEPGAVFVDTYLYRHVDPAIDGLRRLGFGPFVGFGQAWYPGRYRGFVALLRVQRKLRRFLRLLDHHVVVSESMRADYERLGIEPAKVDVALPGFELLSNTPRPQPRNGGPLRVRMAGPYGEAIGQHLLVDAVERMSARYPDLVRVMRIEAIGPKTQAAAYAHDLEIRARRLPRGLLTLSGPYPQNELWKAFGETDVLVYPAVGAGLGRVAIEAMLCGAFPVVSPDGPLRDVVCEDSMAGLVIPRDAESIAKALLNLAGDPQLQARREAAAARAASLVPSWPRAIERVADVLERVSVVRMPRAHSSRRRSTRTPSVWAGTQDLLEALR
jgi:glycosyltransferase involved in cell wall biosynthesis